MEDLSVAPKAPEFTACPITGTPGKTVKMVTLKALLSPYALATLEPKSTFRFCPDAGCDVVYFSADQTYHVADIKVSVFQKDQAPEVPACYCFGYSRSDVTRAAEAGTGQAIENSITAHIKAGRCGCEVRNPQSSCCLGNVKAMVRRLTA